MDYKTLGYYKKMCEILFPEKGLDYINEKISEAPNGENEKVIQQEREIVYLLSCIEYEIII